MNPRLRSMTLDGERMILVIDRVEGLSPDDGRNFDQLAKRVGAAGGVAFQESVDLPNDDPQPEGLTIHADELAALRWAYEALDLTPIGGNPGELNPDSEPARNLTALRLLIQRAEQ